MKIKKLIERLQQENQESEVCFRAEDTSGVSPTGYPGFTVLYLEDPSDYIILDEKAEVEVFSITEKGCKVAEQLLD